MYVIMLTAQVTKLYTRPLTLRSVCRYRTSVNLKSVMHVICYSHSLYYAGQVKTLNMLLDWC